MKGSYEEKGGRGGGVGPPRLGPRRVAVTGPRAAAHGFHAVQCAF